MLDLDSGNTPEKSKGEYLDMYEGIQSQVISTSSFDENSDLSTAYLGRIDITRASMIKVQENFPYQNRGIQYENYCMEQNVRYYLIQKQSNHFCANHIIYDVNLYIHCKDLLLKCKKFK